MRQVARNMTDAIDGPLRNARYLIHDRDSKYTAAFDETMRGAGVKPVKLPPRSPNLNAYAERWGLSTKSEALDHLILFNERQVRRVLREYLADYHEERCHQGLDGELIHPGPTFVDGDITCRKCLGGLLQHYYRAAA